MWKDYFSGNILNEGYEYFKAGAVDDFHYTNGYITARVLDYNVCIDFKDNKINSSYCDCRVHSCTHQSAALFYFDNHHQKDYSKLLSSFSHDELVDFLKRELPNNMELVNQLEMYKNGNADCEFYKKRLQKSLSSYVKVIEFIFIDLKKLKAMGEIELILALLNYIVAYLYELKNIGMYDEYDVILDMVGH